MVQFNPEVLYPRDIVARARAAMKIGGKKAKTTALKAGMACTFRHYGEKDLVKRITCE